MAGAPAFGGALLAFTAGFVDAVGFVGLDGLFTAHVTGNFVLIGAELAGLSESGGLIGKLAALPVFVAVVAATRLALRGGAPPGPGAARLLLATEAMLILAFLALAVLASPVPDADAPLALAAGMAGVAAMAVQNADARLLSPGRPPTTIMTGNTTQAAIDLTTLARPSTAPERDAARARLGRVLPAILAFAAGAILGALGFAALGFWCLLAPFLALLLLVATPALVTEEAR